MMGNVWSKLWRCSPMHPAQSNNMKILRNCAKAIIIREQSILTVMYSDEGGEYYALPGGGQLHGETLTEALFRECREELGISVKSKGIRFIREYIGKDGESSWRDGNVHQIEFIFECELYAGEDPLGGFYKDHSQVGIVWLPIESIADYRFYPKKLIAYLREPLSNQMEYWGSVE